MPTRSGIHPLLNAASGTYHSSETTQTTLQFFEPRPAEIRPSIVGKVEGARVNATLDSNQTDHLDVYIFELLFKKTNESKDVVQRNNKNVVIGT